MPSPDIPPETQRGPGYETRDVDPKVILWLVASIVVVVGASMVGLRILMNAESATDNRPLHASTVDQTPPPPRLQDRPTQDYQAFVAQQEEQLHSYGWVDRQKRIVRIPVERAMDLAIEKGLPQPVIPSADPQPTSDEPSADTPE